MLYREIISVCPQIHIKHINSLCGQNVEFANVKRGGTYSNHGALQGFNNSHHKLRHATHAAPRVSYSISEHNAAIAQINLPVFN